MAQPASIISLMRALSLSDAAQTSSALARRLECPVESAELTLQTLSDVFGAAACGADGKWRLLFTPEWLDATFLTSALPKVEVTVTDEPPGTNALAKEAKCNSVFFAEHQTQGRGRRGRNWLAMPGGAVMTSARLSAPQPLAGLSLAVGAALWRALGGNDKLRLKWPNDLLDVDGRKLGGILIETAGADVIVGAGINLVMTETLSRHISRPTSAYRAASRNDCAALVSDTIWQSVAKFATHGLGAFLPDIAAAHYIRPDEEMQFTPSDGSAVRGRFAGVGEEGALLLWRRGGVHRYLSGEVSGVAGS